jgi:hypothetical protein
MLLASSFGSITWLRGDGGGRRTREGGGVRAARAGERVPLVQGEKEPLFFASSQHAPVLVLLVLVLAAVLDLVQDLLRDHREVLHGLSLSKNDRCAITKGNEGLEGRGLEVERARRAQRAGRAGRLVLRAGVWHAYTRRRRARAAAPRTHRHKERSGFKNRARHRKNPLGPQHHHTRRSSPARDVQPPVLKHAPGAAQWPA